MFAPIFEIAAQDATVKNLLGTGAVGDPVRLYPFGLAPQEKPEDRIYPYAVWQNVSGYPENYLAGRPKEDHFTVQVDVYGKNAASVRAVSLALNNALELQAYVVRFGDEDRDRETKNYHYSFDVDFITPRQ